MTITALGQQKRIPTKKPIKYRVLGRPMPGIAAIWGYGSYFDAESAIRRLKKMTTTTDEESIRRLSNVKIVKANPRGYIPADAKYVNYWVESYPSGKNVTRELLAQFIHDPANGRKKKTIAWAVEEVIRQETNVVDTGWRKSGYGSVKRRPIPRRAQ